MTKPKENADSTLDYQQLAEHMLGSWQDQWRQFAGNKENPFAQAPFGNYGDWLSTWSNAMSNWTATPDAKAPASPTAPKTPEETTPHAATAAPTTASATPTGNSAAASPVSAPAAPASNARDVLLTELARRVEFLHERVVALESELDKLKCAKQPD